MLTLIVQQYCRCFETSENFSEKEKAGEKIELFWASPNQSTTNTFSMSSRVLVGSEDVLFDDL